MPLENATARLSKPNVAEELKLPIADLMTVVSNFDTHICIKKKCLYDGGKKIEITQ
jgi:hypothetical protein